MKTRKTLSVLQMTSLVGAVIVAPAHGWRRSDGLEKQILSSRSLVVVGLLGIFLWLFFFSISAHAAEPPLPEWIWSDEDRQGHSEFETSKNFTIGGQVSSAQLTITADFSRVTLQVNGKRLIKLEPYDPPATLDFRHLLVPGKNQVTILASGVDGPSALAARIQIHHSGDDTLDFITDSTWRRKDESPVKTFGRIHPHRWAPNHLPKISPFAEYNQWKEALEQDGGEASTAAKISPLPPGFEIELVRNARADEGSWISLAIDPKGRLIIAREQQGLIRLTLPENAGGEIISEVIDDSLEECRGIVWKGDSLFANANKSKGLYRLRDTDGDDRFDEVVLLKAIKGGGHGRNDLALGPDNKIHMIHGDSVSVPKEALRLSVAEKNAPRELGHWASTDVEGKQWINRTRGLRNPYGIDFNSEGEFFTYDADNEGDIGLPFYRPTRINHLVSGANYGWHQDRGNTRNLTVYAPDCVPTTYDVGRGSPTAVKFGTHSNFPPPWRQALFALDWAYGRIVAVHLIPRGSSYYGSGEVFLEGRPLNVTDLDFDDRGAMYFVTGGRKTQSALYRVSYTGEAVQQEAPSPQFRVRSRFSDGARQFRRKFERLHGNPDPPSFEEAWESLGHDDPWIRNAARVAVETQALERWRQRALKAPETLQGLTALLALARAGSDEDRSSVIQRASELKTAGWHRTEKLTLLRVYEICEATPEKVQPKTINRIIVQISPWLPDISDPVNRELSRILIALQAPVAVDGSLRLLASAADQLERLHYLEMLSEARIGWTVKKRELYFRKVDHAKRFSQGDRFMLGFFEQLEKNALASIEDETERTRFSALLAKDKANTSAFENLPLRKMVKHWAMADFSADDLNSPLSKRDTKNGSYLFSAALCDRCHVLGTAGRPVGPDLTTVSSRFSRRDLLEAIIEPSKVVAEVHRNVIIEHKDGTTTQGRIILNDFRQSLLSVATSPFDPGQLTEIPKDKIDSYEDSPVSPMPPALLDTLTREEVFDLLAWIESGGAASTQKGELVAYYPLDGDARDHSAYANHGIIHGAVPTKGKIGQAYNFDGTDDYIDIGNPSQLQLTDNFTVSGWVKLHLDDESDVEDGWYGIVSKNRWAGGKGGMHGWMLYRGEPAGKVMSRQFRFTIGDGKGPQYTDSPVNHPDLNWHFVVAVKDGLETRLYVDGQQVGKRALRDLLISESGENASIGRQYSSHVKGVNAFARGKIDEVKIWNYVLSNEAIMREYLDGK